MTVESKIISAHIAALNDGYNYTDRGLIQHYLELSLHELINEKHPSLSDTDRKELVKAIKMVKHKNYRLPTQVD